MVSRKVRRKLALTDVLFEEIDFLSCDEVSRIYFPGEDPLDRVVTKGLKKGYIVNYSASEDILLVGEGDFSFSLGLARALGDATNMVATSLDMPDMLREKYSHAIENVRELRALGCIVLHGISVHEMNKHDYLVWRKFQKIVFNFPYAALRHPNMDYNPKQIKLHQNLLGGFFSKSMKLLSEGGEVHVSHKMTYPYDEWHVEEIARKNGLQLIDCVPFWLKDYPGYSHKRGYGNNGLSDTSFPLGVSATFKFTAADSCVPPRRGLASCLIFSEETEKCIEVGLRCLLHQRKQKAMKQTDGKPCQQHRAGFAKLPICVWIQDPLVAIGGDDEQRIHDGELFCSFQMKTVEKTLPTLKSMKK